LLADAVVRLGEVRAGLRVTEATEGAAAAGEPLLTAEWLVALDAVKFSCETRTTGEPGSRGYLDFLVDFLRSAAARANSRPA
jgi:hypothetical protein